MLSHTFAQEWLSPILSPTAFLGQVRAWRQGLISAVSCEMQGLVSEVRELWSLSGHLAAKTVLQSVGAAVSASDEDRTAMFEVRAALCLRPDSDPSAACNGAEESWASPETRTCKCTGWQHESGPVNLGMT